VAELVDARDLKSLDGNVVWVRVPPPAPSKIRNFSHYQAKELVSVAALCQQYVSNPHPPIAGRHKRLCTAALTRSGLPSTLADNACHWPVAGSGAETLFCNASRNGSWHPSYCRHHAARSVAIDGPRVFAAECPRPLWCA
jgi:hypothetical protein